MSELEDDGAEVGTCALCGQEMIRTVDDCWHPHTVATACPVEPGRDAWREDDPNGWPAFYRRGLRPLRPGREHFRPTGAGR